MVTTYIKAVSGILVAAFAIFMGVLCGILAVRSRNLVYGVMVLCCLYIAVVWGRHGIGCLTKHKVHSHK